MKMDMLEYRHQIWQFDVPCNEHHLASRHLCLSVQENISSARMTLQLQTMSSMIQEIQCENGYYLTSIFTTYILFHFLFIAYAHLWCCAYAFFLYCMEVLCLYSGHPVIRLQMHCLSGHNDLDLVVC